MVGKLTIVEMLILVLAFTISILALFTFNVNAQELARSARNDTVTNCTHGKNSSGISFTSNNVTMTKGDILREKGVPGKGIGTAPGLKKPFNTNAEEHAGMNKLFYKFMETMQKHFAGKDKDGFSAE